MGEEGGEEGEEGRGEWEWEWERRGEGQWGGEEGRGRVPLMRSLRMASKKRATFRMFFFLICCFLVSCKVC